MMQVIWSSNLAHILFLPLGKVTLEHGECNETCSLLLCHLLKDAVSIQVLAADNDLALIHPIESQTPKYKQILWLICQLHSLG